MAEETDKTFDDPDSGDESFAASACGATSEGVYSSRVWMLSIRPVRRLSEFSPSSLLFQPDIRLFCPHGSACSMNQDHQLMYSHELPNFESIVTPDNPEVCPFASSPPIATIGNSWGESNLVTWKQLYFPERR
jgi:hypothetical protein